MRRLTLVLLTLGFAAPASAASGVSIAQLDRLLANAQGRSDAKTAALISRVELTERVSPGQLASWEAAFRGRRTREALLAIADESAFLDAPASDLVSGAMSGPADQAQILARAADYVSKTMARLPDFYATRDTTAFEDAPVHPVAVGRMADSLYAGLRNPFTSGTIESKYQPLHVIGNSRMTITYRNGYEVDARRGGGRRRPISYSGLTTQGEFGPILSTVMGDVAQGSVVFDHWEHGGSGTVAVFHYWVPQQSAHWMVTLPHGEQTVSLFPAYHGAISIDPTTGAILRLTEIADFPSPYQMIKAAILVEYGPVVLGNHRYICPVKGIAISKLPILGSAGAQEAAPPMQTWLNDVSFTKYHLFRAEMRILPGAGPAPSSSPAPER